MKVVLNGLIAFGVLALAQFASAAVILQYHHISEDTPPSTSTSPKLFRQHLAYLDKQDFEVLRLERVLSALRNGKQLPEKTAVITFDDAYRSIYEKAFPLLKRYDFPFTIFVNADPINAGNDTDFTTWDELQTMSDAGATIANHTSTHPHMVRFKKGESLSEWRERMSEELSRTEKAIEKHLDQSHKMLAYPFGEYDAKVKKLLKDEGYIGLGQHSGAVGPGSDFLALPRFPMGASYGSMDNFGTKAHTLALPYTEKCLSLKGKTLDEPVINAGPAPTVTLTFATPELASRLTCYYGGQTLKTQTGGRKVSVTPERDLNPGRARYNCTARNSETGRFHWFSQAWLVRGENGEWQHTD